MTGTELKNMKLHETATCGNYEITRVNGGWIYCRYQTSFPVFVPLTFEFSNKEYLENA